MTTRLIRSAVGTLFVGVLLVALAGCDSSGDGPTSLDGSYSATRLIGQTNAQDGVSLIDLGGSLSFTFESDGTVSGTFVVPAEISESGEVEEQPLAGSYDLSADGELRFDFDEAGSETFIGAVDIDWRYDDEDDEIRGNAGGFQAVLTQFTNL